MNGSEKIQFCLVEFELTMIEKRKMIAKFEIDLNFKQKKNKFNFSQKTYD